MGNIVSLFEKTGWLDIVSFDQMLDATIEPVTVTKKKVIFLFVLSHAHFFPTAKMIRMIMSTPLMVRNRKVGKSSGGTMFSIPGFFGGDGMGVPGFTTAKFATPVLVVFDFVHPTVR